MALLRLPSGRAIGLQPDECLEVGRGLLWTEWGLNVSRVQFDVRLEKEESSMLALVRVVGRGTVNKTVVTVGPEKKRIVLGIKETAVLKRGDRIGLEGQRPALALRFEIEDSASLGGSDVKTETRSPASGVEDVVADGIEKKKAASPAVDSRVTAAAASAGGSPQRGLPLKRQDYDASAGKGVMLVLVGIPGSGKSTFCKKLEELGKWVRINQDSIRRGKPGSKDQCLQAARSALGSGKSCLIDRMNATPDQRGDFMNIARSQASSSHALVLNIEPQVCVERVVDRRDHEGGVQGKGGARVVHMNKNSLARSGAPTLAEGFSSVRICNDVESVAKACDFWTKVTDSRDIGTSEQLKAVEGKVMGKLREWVKPKSPKKKQKKSTPTRGVKRPKSESPSSAAQLGPKRPRSSATPAHMEGLRNAFDVLMASSRRKMSSTPEERPKSPPNSPPPRSPPAGGSKKSTKFPSAWQQVLHKIANRPDDHKPRFPGMLVDERCVVIRDCFPKAMHHYLVIARDTQLEGIDDVQRKHSQLLMHMKEVGESVVSKLAVPKGATFRYGFHSVPSMRQLHMHVISTDFDAPGLKNKKHWNSFTTEFFLNFDDVVESLEKTGCIDVNVEEAEEMLKRPLACHRCQKVQGTMPKLKEHIRSCGL
ncbi:hypothetical protein BSKO_03467 [Bryopsis sp. KO-2023]|nr:hypothetical protein BSKO_03467 [Bryopsis sp. KO-2023]